MPIFEYRCRGCHHHFEELIMGGRSPTCPRCGAIELDKQLSVFAPRAGGNGGRETSAPVGCGRCGDPRGPGACASG